MVIIAIINPRLPQMGLVHRHPCGTDSLGCQLKEKKQLLRRSLSDNPVGVVDFPFSLPRISYVVI